MRLLQLAGEVRHADISIHASRMGCDRGVWTVVQDRGISIHASRMGCDLSSAMACQSGVFQSTHPVWDATVLCGRCVTDTCLFQSTHPVWDATAVLLALEGVVEISIHASRMGCDLDHAIFHPLSVISIHASRMGCDF